MTVRLSICIPTYNRADCLRETLESIASQYREDIEVVVSDNASTDSTAQVIDEFRTIFPRLVFHRWPRNMGADRNFLKVIELASGEYCWFMSSDDTIEPGAINHILEKLSVHQNLCGASVNQVVRSPDMMATLRGKPLAGGKLKCDRLFVNAEECASLLGLYFGYLPGQVVNRSLWLKVVETENVSAYFNAFVHVFVICKMLRINANWLYLHHPCVAYRSGNDSFLQEIGLYGRQVIAHTSFLHAISGVFGDATIIYRKLQHMTLVTHMASDLRGFKINGASISLQIKLFSLYTKHYGRFPYFWLRVVPIFLIPSFVLRILRRIYRALPRKRDGLSVPIDLAKRA
jgi:abequosyltransferase